MGGFANNAPIVTDGLVFYVDAGNSKSYDGVSGGTTWTDLVGGNDGTLTNMETNPANAGYVYESANGGGISFDGSNDYISLPSGVLPSNTNVTISIILKNNYLSQTSNRGILGINGSPRFYLYMASTGGPSYPHSVLAVYNGSSYASPGGGNCTFPVGETHSFSLVIDGSGNFKYYKDGALESSVTGISFSSSGDTYLGAYPTLTNNGQFTFYNVRIYNRALSASELLQNYNALKNRFV
jgi:hypothetical protein